MIDIDAIRRRVAVWGTDTGTLRNEIASLCDEVERLGHANESLNMQLQDRIKLEHDQEVYVSCAKERAAWAQKCAGLAREVERLRAGLIIADRGLRRVMTRDDSETEMQIFAEEALAELARVFDRENNTPKEEK